MVKVNSKQVKESDDRYLEIFSILSHEVRTPLNAIIGISDLLQKEESDPYREEYYRILKTTSENLLELVNNILDFSKLNSGVLEVNRRSFDIRQKIKDSLHSQKPAARAKGLAFNLHFDPNLPPLVIGDQVKVAQIFINLVSNSVKFTNEGKVEVVLELKEENLTSIVIEGRVSDTGIGIPSYQLDKIFDAFHQGEEDINITYAGTGLGLNITKQLIKMLKGSLQVESEPGKGTCFTFKLPFGKVDESEQIEQKISEFDLSRLRGRKILLAEDNKVNQLVISRYLQLWKTDFTIVENGKEALEEIINSDFDVVLMDIHMPVMNGMEAVERLRSFAEPKYHSLPVIALTAAVDDAGSRNFLFSRFTDFLMKPFEAQKLSELLIVHCNV
ncbi:ATP-binding protein [Salinimicrobium catena]|uniref:ATP-binding protein n=1 Tax=Salinimicrobium catena TaxID=390640 RepID=UPI002FE43E41